MGSVFKIWSRQIVGTEKETNLAKKCYFAGWERYEGAFSPVPEKYGWANGNYFEAQRGRWVLVFYLKTLPKYQHKICPKDPFMVQFMAK